MAKLSITVDQKTLAEIRRLSGKGANISALVADLLRDQVQRLRLLELLEQWERTDPISPKGKATGDKLWQDIVSSSTPERSRRSPRDKKPSAKHSRAS